jgi:hypothetical protein
MNMDYSTARETIEFQTSIFLMRTLSKTNGLYVTTLKITKGVTRRRQSKKDRPHNGQKKKTKGQTTIYKTLDRKPKMEQHEPH